MQQKNCGKQSIYFGPSCDVENCWKEFWREGRELFTYRGIYQLETIMVIA